MKREDERLKLINRLSSMTATQIRDEVREKIKRYVLETSYHWLSYNDNKWWLDKKPERYGASDYATWK